MKSGILAFVAVVLGSFSGNAKSQQRFYAERVWLSGNGTRIVAQGSVHSQNEPKIWIYDALSKRKKGEIPCSGRLVPPLLSNGDPDPSGKLSYQFDHETVKAISHDGRHLLVLRMPVAAFWRLPEDREHPDNLPVLEAWNIAQTPRLEWQKKNVAFLDVRWIQGEIVVLMNKQVERWDERGQLLSHAHLQLGSLTNPLDIGALSADGTRAVLDTAPCTFLDARTGRVIKSFIEAGDATAAFLIGPKNFYLGELGLTISGFEGSVPGYGDYLRRLSDGKVVENDISTEENGSEDGHLQEVFSSDGLSLWDTNKRHFVNISSGKVALIPIPPLFARKTSWLQAISDDGCVWAGVDMSSPGYARTPIWTVTK